MTPSFAFLSIDDIMNLSPSMVASSFGKLVMKEQESVKKVKEEDIAIALLMMITNNIGQVFYSDKFVRLLCLFHSFIYSLSFTNEY
jgi:pantothenate kinase